MDIKSKLSSRKFWMSVAAFLGSIATSIAGIATSNPKVAIAGVVCATLSSAIYSGCEAYVDGAYAMMPEIEIEDSVEVEDDKEE